MFSDANDCIEFLNGKFEACDSPSYSIMLKDAEKLNEERAEDRYKRSPTVKRPSSFQVKMIFHPDSSVIKVVPYLCGCHLCLSSRYGSCELFCQYTLKTGLLNKVSLRHKYQEYSKDDEIQDTLEIGDLVSNDQIVAIAAENSSNNTVWFVYLTRVNCVDLSSNNMEDYDHSVSKLQPYLLCNYLEKLNVNKKGVVYQRSKKRFSFTKKVLCIHSLSLNQTTTKKKIYFF